MSPQLRWKVHQTQDHPLSGLLIHFLTKTTHDQRSHFCGLNGVSTGARHPWLIELWLQAQSEALSSSVPEGGRHWHGRVAPTLLTESKLVDETLIVLKSVYFL